MKKNNRMQKNYSIPTIEGRQRVLIAPLNWGLGHASRCIPIIKKLVSDGHYILIAADSYPLQMLRQEFPELPFRVLPSFTVRYSRGSSQVGAMLRGLPSIVRGVVHEHRQLQQIIREENITYVISDNRFGLYTPLVPCVYITHQLMIKMPRALQWLEPVAWWMHRRVINKYTECWVPDVAEAPGLSGDLAHKYPLPRRVRFIGSLSRFSCTPDVEVAETFHTVAVLSGPEPHRGLLEQQLLEKYRGEGLSVLIVRGQPQADVHREQRGNITLVSHLPATELKAQLLAATEIICRSGYSSLMDLQALHRTATLIPTPGQTEQEYLAELSKL
jgi:UDP:flavonoid glycosyltransferase YjiC (YdhE family)